MPGIEMSSSTASNRSAWISRSAVIASPATATSATSGGLQQQRAQLVQRRGHVVDGQHPQPRCARGHDATTPGWKRGSRSSTRVPAPAAVSMTRP